MWMAIITVPRWFFRLTVGAIVTAVAWLASSVQSAYAQIISVGWDDSTGRVDANFGSNNDTISVFADSDSVKATDGSSTCLVFKGDGTVVDPIEVRKVSINAGGGHDIIDMTEMHNDFLFPGSAPFNVDAGSGNDTIPGSNDDDHVIGGAGSDIINGNAGWDTLLGGDDNDCIFGHAGGDSILGGSGADVLDAGNDSDTDRVYHNISGVNGGDADGYQDSLFVDQQMDFGIINTPIDNDQINP